MNLRTKLHPDIWTTFLAVWHLRRDPLIFDTQPEFCYAGIYTMVILINTILYENYTGPFGGCAGYGRGAALNFMASLADGKRRACRKFPLTSDDAHKEEPT